MMAKFLEENGYGFQGPGLKTGVVNKKMVMDFRGQV